MKPKFKIKNKIYADGADLNYIKRLNKFNLEVLLQPSLIKQSGYKRYMDIRELLKILKSQFHLKYFQIIMSK